MQNDPSYLNSLVGKTLIKINLSTNTIIAIRTSENDPENVRYTLSLQLYFDEYILRINNPIMLVPAEKQVEDFIGLTVISAGGMPQEARFAFNNGWMMTVDMRDEVYYDPESMTLSGPNGFLAVWN